MWRDRTGCRVDRFVPGQGCNQVNIPRIATKISQLSPAKLPHHQRTGCHDHLELHVRRHPGQFDKSAPVDRGGESGGKSVVCGPQLTKELTCPRQLPYRYSSSLLCKDLHISILYDELAARLNTFYSGQAVGIGIPQKMDLDFPQKKEV